MTDQATTTPEEPLFTAVEVEQFQDDDTVAGSAIGKMLSILFLYTVLVMSLVSWWTFSANSTSQTEDPAAEHAGH